MTEIEVYEVLNSIFRTVFDDESITVDENTTSDDIEDWDSLEHINLIVAVEKSFEIKFSINEIHSMESVGDMARMILAKKN